MARQVAWSPEALEDLESIAEYIARDSRAYASAVATRILKLARDLSHAPYIGRMVPEVDDPNIRERFAYSYRLIYWIRETRITIVAVIHGKRSFESFRERLDA